MRNINIFQLPNVNTCMIQYKCISIAQCKCMYDSIQVVFLRTLNDKKLISYKTLGETPWMLHV